MIIEGESLFNDGVAGSLYQTFLAAVLLSVSGQTSDGILAWGEGLLSFLLEAGGGILFGVAVGWLVSQIVRRFDEPLVETTLTIVTAYGVYLLADQLHLSAIVAVIVAALVLGNYGRAIGMSERTQSAVDNFWGLLAFIANALIFLLVGVQLNPQTLPFSAGSEMTSLLTASFAVGVVLLARLALVLLLSARSLLDIAVPGRSISPNRRQRMPRTWRLVLFWSGLRGALSLALVLGLPIEIPNRSILLVSTYAVVFFTLLVQGISLSWLLKSMPLLQAPPVDREMAPPAGEQVSETSV